MEAKPEIILRTMFLLIVASSVAFGQATEQERKSFEEHIRETVPTRKEIDVFLNEMSWAQFDRDIGYILGNYMPHDGMDGSSTISTVQSNGARTSFMYKNRPCRINTYGDSFTQCHQVSDGETWQEYLAAHFGEPVRNFGMGGLGVYQAYRRMIREEKTDHGAKYIILYIWGDERPVRDNKADAFACIPGFALLGKYLPEYLILAERLYENHSGNMQTILALYNATHKQIYRDAARKRAIRLLSDQKTTYFRELAEYAVTFPDDKSILDIKSIAKIRLDELKMKCDNPFRITRRMDGNGNLVYFRHYLDVNNWYVGESRELLDTAYEGILLEKLGFPEGRQISSNQAHWILGLNPYGVSMMEGVGTFFVPYYHHRYNTLPDNPRGAVPGAIINGVTRVWPDHDRPWLDLYPEPTPDYQTNEPWLPHNNRWLFLIAIW